MQASCSWEKIVKISGLAAKNANREKFMSEEQSKHIYDVIVVGGGAAGVGVSVALKDAGIENFIILERHHLLGASFLLWPAETRFISPSFATNSIGMLDLNAIAMGTSPAVMLECEHPTGEDYAAYLNAVAQHYELPVRPGTNIVRISKDEDLFQVKTPQLVFQAKHVIWAAGEFQYPRLAAFAGSKLCRHTATVPSYEELEEDDFVVVGGYESGIDAAYHLAQRGKKVQVLDEGSPWQEESSDPSVALSTYSIERMRSYEFVSKVELVADTRIESVSLVDGIYELTSVDGRSFKTKTQPLLAGGFEGSHRIVKELFEPREDGFPLLNEQDESTFVPGLFLCGPSVRHENHVFCFIYKYRQRFAVVAKTIATSLGLEAEGLEIYRKWGMYLDDLSCCGEECVC